MCRRARDRASARTKKKHLFPNRQNRLTSDVRRQGASFVHSFRLSLFRWFLVCFAFGHATLRRPFHVDPQALCFQRHRRWKTFQATTHDRRKRRTRTNAGGNQKCICKHCASSRTLPTNTNRNKQPRSNGTRAGHADGVGTRQTGKAKSESSHRLHRPRVLVFVGTYKSCRNTATQLQRGGCARVHACQTACSSCFR